MYAIKKLICLVTNTFLNNCHFYFAVTDWNTSERLISEPYFLKTGPLHTAQHYGILSCSDETETDLTLYIFVFMKKKIFRINFKSVLIE